MKALLKTEDLALIESTSVNIWRKEHPISVSKNNFKDINLLGLDYFKKANIQLDCYYNY